MTWYRYRSVSAEQALAIRRAHDSGARVSDLAAAYGVSTRAVYRAMHRVYLPTREIVVDEWRATFEIGPEGPVRISPWMPT